MIHILSSTSNNRETDEWLLSHYDSSLDKSVYHFAGGFLSNNFFLLKIMWLRKSVPSKCAWPFSDELAVVAHWFPVLPTRQEERALIHNLESRPKSDERDCFENKKTNNSSLNRRKENYTKCQALAQMLRASSSSERPIAEGSAFLHNNIIWGHRVLMLKRHSFISGGHHSHIGQKTSSPCLPLSVSDMKKSRSPLEL